MVIGGRRGREVRTGKTKVSSSRRCCWETNSVSLSSRRKSGRGVKVSRRCWDRLSHTRGDLTPCVVGVRVAGDWHTIVW